LTYQMIRSWTQGINLKGNYGAHTLRKTFGCVQRTRLGVGFETLAKRFNHCSPAITMRYLGIQSQEVHQDVISFRSPTCIFSPLSRFPSDAE
jgi:integrase